MALRQAAFRAANIHIETTRLFKVFLIASDSSENRFALFAPMLVL
jgi:hypothetical protein